MPFQILHKFLFMSLNIFYIYLSLINIVWYVLSWLGFIVCTVLKRSSSNNEVSLILHQSFRGSKSDDQVSMLHLPFQWLTAQTGLQNTINDRNPLSGHKKAVIKETYNLLFWLGLSCRRISRGNCIFRYHVFIQSCVCSKY